MNPTSVRGPFRPPKIRPTVVPDHAWLEFEVRRAEQRLGCLGVSAFRVRLTFSLSRSPRFWAPSCHLKRSGLAGPVSDHDSHYANLPASPWLEHLLDSHVSSHLAVSVRRGQRPSPLMTMSPLHQPGVASPIVVSHTRRDLQRLSTSC